MNQELLLSRARERSLKGWATMYALVHNERPTDNMIEAPSRRTN